MPTIMARLSVDLAGAELCGMMKKEREPGSGRLNHLGLMGLFCQREHLGSTARFLPLVRGMVLAFASGAFRFSISLVP